MPGSEESPPRTVRRECRVDKSFRARLFKSIDCPLPRRMIGDRRRTGGKLLCRQCRVAGRTLCGVTNVFMPERRRKISSVGIDGVIVGMVEGFWRGIWEERRGEEVWDEGRYVVYEKIYMYETKLKVRSILYGPLSTANNHSLSCCKTKLECQFFRAANFFTTPRFLLPIE